MRRTCLASVAVLALAVTTASAEEIPNPEFVSWGKFKKGTSVTLKTVSTAGAVTSEVLMTSTLVEVGADKVVLESTVVTKVNGMEFKTPAAKRDVPKTLKLPDNVKKPDPKDAKVEKPTGTYEEGTETLKVGGAEIKTKWYKTRAESDGLKTESKVWTSDDVPGIMIKMEATTTGTAASTVKVELIEFKKP